MNSQAVCQQLANVASPRPAGRAIWLSGDGAGLSAVTSGHRHCRQRPSSYAFGLEFSSSLEERCCLCKAKELNTHLTCVEFNEIRCSLQMCTFFFFFPDIIKELLFPVATLFCATLGCAVHTTGK